MDYSRPPQQILNYHQSQQPIQYAQQAPAGLGSGVMMSASQVNPIGSQSHQASQGLTYNNSANTQASFANLQELNSKLWSQVHKLEFKLVQQMEKKKRDEKLFAKKLVRMAKYLELKGIAGSELQSLLVAERKQNAEDFSISKVKMLNKFNDKAWASDLSSSDDDNEDEQFKVMTGAQNDNLRNKSKRQKKGASSLAVAKGKENVEETESDSDFENLQKHPGVSGERQYLEDYLTLGELGGKIPPSLLVNVSFEKFAKENGFEPLSIEPIVNGGSTNINLQHISSSQYRESHKSSKQNGDQHHHSHKHGSHHK